ncbi:Plant ubx domain-containing protein [Thalictrum thalictroides]|uniref:Plant ubx domain-containing protein n=1 Tax=Thalictrum thalictroides TaxID=46969 RepID=A0A7J6W8S2_THATH|nr:Plant ubx domain-containing protein [Thalictrum thalictroides]
MARPNQEAIETFINITGASEDVALQKLLEHGGDLNEAVNSHFSEGDRSITRHPTSIPASQNDLMDIDDEAIEVEPQRPTFPLFSAAQQLNPFSLLDPNFRRSFLEGHSAAEFTSGAPRVTHPREVRQIPIEFKDEHTQSGHSGLSPAIEDVTGTAHAHLPEAHGTVIVDDEEDEGIPTVPTAPRLDRVADYGNDIEEEMIRAAIEASRREVVEGFPNQHIGDITDSSGPSLQQTHSQIEDPDLARAVSLSLKTAEQEKALREQGTSVGTARESASVASDVEELESITGASGRQGIGAFNRGTLNQPKLEAGSSYVQDEAEDVEEQPLEHGGDLNEAVNSHFSEGDRSITRHPTSIPASQNDLMDIDDEAIEVEPQRPTFPLFSAAQQLNPFSLLDPNFRRSFLEGHSAAEFTSGAPRVTHPREVRQIPIEFKDEHTQSGHSGLSPAIEDVTGTAHAHLPEAHGTVIVDDEEDEGIPTVPTAPRLDRVADYGNDIEEEMIRAAIEASRREVVEGFPNQHIGDITDSSGPSLQQTHSQIEDPDLARAVSLSLKTAEQEKALREQGTSVGTARESASVASDVEELESITGASGRQGIGAFNRGTLNQPKLEAGSSYVQDEAEDVEEQPLVRQRSRRVSFGSDSVKEASEMDDDSPPSSPGPRDIGDHPQNNGAPFPSDEWGGISSEEHDEAVMLEAALFGGVPEGTAYRFGYQPQESMQMGSDRGLYPRPQPRPPSPTLEAQRLLREQQDDEYFASLQADREKELKAIEEAEARRVSEEVAREAALEEEKRKDEESRKKILEEQELQRQLAAKEASLPMEPALGDENAVTLLVRMPDGSRRGRRFLKSDNLQSLFDFIDVGRAVKPGTYRLVRPYPRRAFSEGESRLSLSDLGLTSKQEALFLELI